jgi:hypothetical protein
MKKEDLIEQFLSFLGNTPPLWLRVLLIVLMLLAGLGPALTLIAKVFGAGQRFFFSYIVPHFYNREERKRVARRQRFALHLEQEIEWLNGKEDWKDHCFTELEAEVEAEGRFRKRGIFSALRRTRSGLRREKSLTRALEQTKERLVLLQGDPGAGKSVALRHVAQRMAGRARRLTRTEVS